ncbi:unnamed protein product [Acanthosepion pharaonis]|uniref:Uncharacterized protein n=1 Tax=Acanthosepion pharaonis TaxID=158019 RepID=A0A812CB66_ACAPH|nr:unnamed protein product [Sepia pharaonis]
MRRPFSRDFTRHTGFLFEIIFFLIYQYFFINIYLSIYLFYLSFLYQGLIISIYLSILRNFNHLSIYLSDLSTIYLQSFLSIYLSIYLFIYSGIHAIHLSRGINLLRSIYLDIGTHIYLRIDEPVRIESIYLSIYRKTSIHQTPRAFIFIYSFFYPFIPRTSRSIYLILFLLLSFIYLSIYLYTFYLSIYLSTHKSIYLKKENL